jgi:hypothetical protein
MSLALCRGFVYVGIILFLDEKPYATLASIRHCEANGS